MVGENKQYIRVKVIPSSPTTEIVGEMADGTLKIRLHAKPEKGKANIELIQFLSHHYKVPKTDITIISGKTDTIKLIKITHAPST